MTIKDLCRIFEETRFITADLVVRQDYTFEEFEGFNKRLRIRDIMRTPLKDYVISEIRNISSDEIILDIKSERIINEMDVKMCDFIKLLNFVNDNLNYLSIEYYINNNSIRTGRLKEYNDWKISKLNSKCNGNRIYALDFTLERVTEEPTE